MPEPLLAAVAARARLRDAARSRPGGVDALAEALRSLRSALARGGAGARVGGADSDADAIRRAAQSFLAGIPDAYLRSSDGPGDDADRRAAFAACDALRDRVRALGYGEVEDVA
jgi:hypothetical protein